MQEIEKILEEIDERINYYRDNAIMEYVDVCTGLRETQKIIRKHMNDGWISTEERLPKNKGGCDGMAPRPGAVPPGKERIMKPEEAIELLRDTPIDIRSTRDDDIHTLYATAQMMAMDALEEIQPCREAAERLSKAEKALNTILSGDYNDECNFCIHIDNPMANCQCIHDRRSWCIHNARWNGKVSDYENLEVMKDE